MRRNSHIYFMSSLDQVVKALDALDRLDAALDGLAVVPDVGDNSIMDQFVAWFEREAVDDQIEFFVIRNAQRLQLTDTQILSGVDGEQSHAWWPIYEEFRTTFEALLQQFLDESRISADEFAEAARSARGMADTYLIVINALSNYPMFVELMTEEEAKQRRSVVGADGRVRDPKEESAEEGTQSNREAAQADRRPQPVVWGGGEGDPDWVPPDEF